MGERSRSGWTALKSAGSRHGSPGLEHTSPQRPDAPADAAAPRAPLPPPRLHRPHRLRATAPTPTPPDHAPNPAPYRNLGAHRAQPTQPPHSTGPDQPHRPQERLLPPSPLSPLFFAHFFARDRILVRPRGAGISAGLTIHADALSDSRTEGWRTNTQRQCLVDVPWVLVGPS